MKHYDCDDLVSRVVLEPTGLDINLISIWVWGGWSFLSNFAR